MTLLVVVHVRRLFRRVRSQKGKDFVNEETTFFSPNIFSSFSHGIKTLNTDKKKGKKTVAAFLSSEEEEDLIRLLERGDF